MACWKAANLFVAVAVLVIGAGSAAAAENRRVAFFGFFLINTSLQPTQPAEEKRLEMLDIILRDRLADAGRFSFVAIPPRYKSRPSPVLAFRIATDVRRTLPRRLAPYMEDVQTGRIEFAHSVDIRGNTDESWLRGLNYMIRNYVLEQP
jgi:hypothetical protein